MPARFAERLVARAAFLAIPDGLVDHGDGGQDRDLLESENQVGEVGDRAVAVLKVEGQKETSPKRPRRLVIIPGNNSRNA